MRLQRHFKSRRYPLAAFTMVEIAICLGVIGFALVAIIGVLPTGMKVQRDNREETIINHDAVYWLEAIRNGSRDQGSNLSTYVNQVGFPAQQFSNDYDVIGFLSSPGLKTNWIRSMSGSFAEKGGDTNFAFGYQLIVDVVTNRPLPGNAELTLRFRWPYLPSGKIGNGTRLYRTLVAGSLVSNAPAAFFFRPNDFRF